MASSQPDVDLAALQAENAMLRERVALAETAIDELRAEALQRRGEVRQLVADLPVAMSRKTLLRQIARDAIDHPDKKGVVVRAVNKARRGIRKATRRT